MGRVFEKRKHKIFARNAKMSKMFTKFGKEIAMAVKAGGPEPESNSRLRAIIQNAKQANMPKDRIDAAIKRASDKDKDNYEVVLYEGYGPYGVAIAVETATDNPTRTVANIRLYFNRGGGSLGTQGSLDFIFTRKGVFQVPLEGKNMDDFELQLIDWGAEDIEIVDDLLFITTAFEDFGRMQLSLEENKVEVRNAELHRIPNSFAELTAEQEAEIDTLVDRFEDDEDVTAVFTNMR